MSTERVLPFVDRDSAAWWDALARHELVQQRCDGCGRWRWPPRAICGDCGSFEWSWQPVSGRGVVTSWIATHHAFLPGFNAPYHNVFVRLAEQDDIVMPGAWFGEGPPVTGMAVRAHFDDIEREDGRVTLLGWRPQDHHESATGG
jgi:uncharacterized OB-fold protein